MPTPTYDLIEEKVLGSAQASVTFSSIPDTYKDLVLEVIATNASNSDVYVKANGSSTGYSRTYLTGDGSVTASGRNTSQTQWQITLNGFSTSNVGYFAKVDFMSYANTNVNKTMLVRSNNASFGTDAQVELWQSSSAITSLALTATANFNSGSTFRLWGVSG